MLVEAARHRLNDISLAEWAITDMQHWNEMAQAMTSWHHGKTAAGKMAEAHREES